MSNQKTTTKNDTIQMTLFPELNETKLEDVKKENIPAMWLAAMQQPDFRTINEFRGVRMQDMIDELFEVIIQKLIDEHYITMENYFLDETKIEADANKYSFVWKEATSKFEAKLKEKIQKTLKHIHEITKFEAETIQKERDQDSEIDEQTLEEVANELEDKVEQLTEEIEKEPDPSVRKEIRKERSQFKKS